MSGQEAARHILAMNRERQADVPYTPRERAEVERLNLEEFEAIRKYHLPRDAKRLSLARMDIACQRRDISRGARRRATEQGTPPNPVSTH